MSFILTCNNREEWSNLSVWTQMVTDLSISSKENCGTFSISEQVPSQHKDDARQDIQEDGYTLVNSNPIAPTSKPLIDRLSTAITKLHNDYKLPATFIILFDEAWHLAHHANTNILSPISHPANTFNFDILAWYIDPRTAGANSAGFSPHRDRQPPNALVQDSFHKDGQAKYF